MVICAPLFPTLFTILQAVAPIDSAIRPHFQAVRPSGLSETSILVLKRARIRAQSYE
jgi:hypothetical protein